jgi:hypothetical protein
MARWVSDAAVANARAAHAAGETLYSVATRLGVCISAVARWCAGKARTRPVANLGKWVGKRKKSVGGSRSGVHPEKGADRSPDLEPSTINRPEGQKVAQ